YVTSRRRHTRFSRDWSSDVCSSDLSKRRATVRPASGSSWSTSTWAPSAATWSPSSVFDRLSNELLSSFLTALDGLEQVHGDVGQIGRASWRERVCGAVLD